MRKVSVFFALAFLVISGCSRDGGLLVREIQGPTLVISGSTVKYSLSTEPPEDFTCAWAVDPPDAGLFSKPHAESTSFTATTAQTELSATIMVVLNLDVGAPVFKSKRIAITSNNPPTALAHAEPLQINPGMTVRFYDDSTDPDGTENITRWEWDFSFDPARGFEPESDERNPERVFSALGTYDVQLRVTDRGGLTDMLDKPITIEVIPGPVAPVAKARFSPEEGTVCEPVLFADAGSYDPDGGPIVSYEWDFDNDGVWDESGPQIHHAWFKPGTYFVNCRVTDDENQIGLLQQLLEVKIGDNPPVAVAASADIYFSINEEIQFDGSKSYDQDCGGHDIIKWDWDWESDGVYDSEGEILSHSWPQPGTYYVQLRVTDNEGETDTLNNPIKVMVNYGSWPLYFDVPNWSQVNWMQISAMASDSQGNICIIGRFEGPIDFDPGPGQHILTGTEKTYLEPGGGGGLGFYSCFAAKYTEYGVLLWVQTWLGGFCRAVAMSPSGQVYVGGGFVGNVDFDPGPGEDMHDAGYYQSGTNTYLDIDNYVSVFSQDGTYKGVYTWGNDQPFEEVQGMAIDSCGNLYAAGLYSGLVDFDPGPEEHFAPDLSATNYVVGCYLLKFNCDMQFQWVKGWGGESFSEDFKDLDCSPSGMLCFVASYEKVNFDFDPGPGEHIINNPSRCTYISKFNDNGEFLGVIQLRTRIEDTLITDSGEVYVTGAASSGVDIDPGPDTFTYDQSGALVMKLSASGERIWSAGWVGDDDVSNQSDIDMGHSIALDSQGNLYCFGRMNPFFLLDVPNGGGYAGTYCDLDPSHGFDGYLVRLGLQDADEINPLSGIIKYTADGEREFVRTLETVFGPDEIDIRVTSGDWVFAVGFTVRQYDVYHPWMWMYCYYFNRYYVDGTQ